MKKIKLLLTLILAMLCIAALASCGDSDTDKPVSGQTLTLNVYNWGPPGTRGSPACLRYTAL